MKEHVDLISSDLPLAKLFNRILFKIETIRVMSSPRIFDDLHGEMATEKKYIEKEIKKIIAYKNGKLDFLLFKDNIANAVTVSKTLPTDLMELKTLCGTNFAILIEKLKKYAK